MICNVDEVSIELYDQMFQISNSIKSPPIQENEIPSIHKMSSNIVEPSIELYGKRQKISNLTAPPPIQENEIPSAEVFQIIPSNKRQKRSLSTNFIIYGLRTNDNSNAPYPNDKNQDILNTAQQENLKVIKSKNSMEKNLSEISKIKSHDLNSIPNSTNNIPTTKSNINNTKIATIPSWKLLADYKLPNSKTEDKKINNNDILNIQHPFFQNSHDSKSSQNKILKDVKPLYNLEDDRLSILKATKSGYINHDLSSVNARYIPKKQDYRSISPEILKILENKKYESKKNSIPLSKFIGNPSDRNFIQVGRLIANNVNKNLLDQSEDILLDKEQTRKKVMYNILKGISK